MLLFIFFTVLLLFSFKTAKVLIKPWARCSLVLIASWVLDGGTLTAAPVCNMLFLPAGGGSFDDSDLIDAAGGNYKPDGGRTLVCCETPLVNGCLLMYRMWFNYFFPVINIKKYEVALKFCLCLFFKKKLYLDPLYVCVDWVLPRFHTVFFLFLFSSHEVVQETQETLETQETTILTVRLFSLFDLLVL